MTITKSDPLYYPRVELADLLVRNLAEGISSAFTLFAPRRMGKTQFLLNDITKSAEQLGFNVFYFSFMNENRATIQGEFRQALMKFLTEISPTSALKQIKSVEILGVSIEKNEEIAQELPINVLIDEIAKDKKPTLMLLDEVQELARIPKTEGLIRSLRTGLDTNKNQVKVIFTGSSTNGLRKIFDDIKAPFFHFSHTIKFPNLDQKFTDYLAEIYTQRTGNKLDKHQFFTLFEKLQFTPLYLRAITQDMIIDPTMTLEEAAESRLHQIHDQSDFVKDWQNLTALEQQILLFVHRGESGFYKQDIRQKLADALGLEKAISTSSVQTNIKKLINKELLTKQPNGKFILTSGLFGQWLKDNVE
ncbi:selenocysteine synthase [Rodentibacter trehalosifermentans]|uniref:Selenocysteine synthase n=1 Tax=Rodentibacter trehalosifermentans TaxID=1908263 RepID=A0A1V3IYD6_9PAST|nr:ATP-binding protein [Rodentibacter trehalosifermentans]OOF47195.1 selenocysteine synthase [Rodentibacter trehalosifermentans]